MSINLNDIINYGSATFKVVKFLTSQDAVHIQNNINNIVPIGMILPYSANTINPPETFLFCDGSAISRTTYNDLFSLIGTTYGEGDSSTTFNIPNITNKFIEGSTTSGTNIEAGLPNITGWFDGWLAVLYSSGVFTLSGYNTGGYSGTNGYHNVSFNASLSNSIYGNSTTVQPPAITMKYVIKAYE